MRSVRRAGTGGALRPTAAGATPRSLFAAKRVALIGLACRPPRSEGKPITQWSAEELREAFAGLDDGLEVSVATIARELICAKLKPHRWKYFLTSRDPLYDEKRRDIVSLYLRPPPGATVLCFDEKPAIQALARTHPDFPMRPGSVTRREFEYVRHGVMHLFGAFNIRSGKVIAQVHPEKTHAEFIELLEQCAWHYRQGPVHGVLDNAGYHSTPQVMEWLVAHPRFTFHFTPTHASWLNQIEIWFSILYAKVLKRGSFNSKEALAKAILDYVIYWDEHAHPFDWAYGEEFAHQPSVLAA